MRIIPNKVRQLARIVGLVILAVRASCFTLFSMTRYIVFQGKITPLLRHGQYHIGKVAGLILKHFYHPQARRGG